MALLSVLLACWQWVAAWRFPLHTRLPNPSFQPPVTLLKPLKGCDTKTVECLKSWLQQDYKGQVQILFGVAAAEDPACEAVRKLISDHPGSYIQLVICKEALGFNAKVSTLIQLSRLARHEIISVSDADVLVSTDFLKNAVAPLENANTGLVNCFYRLANPSNLAMHWEAIAINADFWSQVLQGQNLQPLDFALGAVMTTRRAQLKSIGGFEALADYLADDFQLGNRIAKTGKEIVISPIVVDCLSHPMGWKEVWAHQLRWARTIRVSKPAPYAMSIISNPTLWPLAWYIMQPTHRVLLFLAISLLARILMAETLQSRFNKDGQRNHCWLAPIKDILQFGIWMQAFFGNSILWRGQRYHLQKDGTLQKV
ncbi:bacteriohopanetetrol glucosamine biosynthesis glycosyltransferase HpnI [Pedosphaera parvula]|uniref:Ceramide glucosyltransferase, putative n=1 Tax=Pedosphaera parvula (strain Ellin514) TaxID=320771 RepID=B9XKE8_PEDPL|nr:bacteriohopanetetrol glucosamine biosynthesis glycosyltransferase HpnI [Pedosphaera parvula]EEF59618.1 ceramide glucosyltransferase, putative [Pedosphaera parvula Ellin514]